MYDFSGPGGKDKTFLISVHRSTAIYPPNKSAVCRAGTLDVLCNLVSANANQVTMVFGCDCVCKRVTCPSGDGAF